MKYLVIKGVLYALDLKGTLNDGFPCIAKYRANKDITGIAFWAPYPKVTGIGEFVQVFKKLEWSDTCPLASEVKA